jgi:mRNA interferase RelE/StbE
VARYVVEITDTADKALRKIKRGQPRDAQRIDAAIVALADDARPAGCKPLLGMDAVWRIRVGNYRICYQIDDEVLLVLVLTLSTRDDVYERLRRMLD